MVKICPYCKKRFVCLSSSKSYGAFGGHIAQCKKIPYELKKEMEKFVIELLKNQVPILWIVEMLRTRYNHGSLWYVAKVARQRNLKRGKIGRRSNKKRLELLNRLQQKFPEESKNLNLSKIDNFGNKIL